MDAATSTEMTRIVQAAVIREAWDAARVAVVRWSHDGSMAERNWNPCGSGDWSIGHDKSWKHKDLHADHIVACPFGKNHIIVSGPTPPIPRRPLGKAKQLTWDTQTPLVENGMKPAERSKILGIPDIGQSEEVPKDYDLTHERVIAAAERTQQRTLQFNAKGIENLGDMFADLSGSPGENMRLRARGVAEVVFGADGQRMVLQDAHRGLRCKVALPVQVTEVSVPGALCLDGRFGDPGQGPASDRLHSFHICVFLRSLPWVILALYSLRSRPTSCIFSPVCPYSCIYSPAYRTL